MIGKPIDQTYLLIDIDWYRSIDNHKSFLANFIMWVMAL